MWRSSTCSEVLVNRTADTLTLANTVLSVHPGGNQSTDHAEWDVELYAVLTHREPGWTQLKSWVLPWLYPSLPG